MIASHVTNTPMGHLMLIMGIRGAPMELESITLTSDGMYLGQVSGDMGYNAFLGRPNSNPLPETRELLQGHWNGLSAPEQDAVAPGRRGCVRPAVEVRGDDGVNGQIEMAASFDAAGFRAVDVHMSDLFEQRVDLSAFHGLVACGGFSYGDALGAGRGWAASILFQQQLRDHFAAFFERVDRFALGVCNGCQMLSLLREIIPGTENWPDFVANRSGQFEARLSMVRVAESASLLFNGMAGSLLPVATAHGEGRAEFNRGSASQASVTLHYVDADGADTMKYPHNPNGSPGGVTGLCNTSGRVTIMMPHPERTLRTVNFSWAPDDWSECSPWQRMFQNARQWLS